MSKNQSLGLPLGKAQDIYFKNLVSQLKTN